MTVPYPFAVQRHHQRPFRELRAGVFRKQGRPTVLVSEMLIKKKNESSLNPCGLWWRNYYCLCLWELNIAWHMTVEYNYKFDWGLYVNLTLFGKLALFLDTLRRKMKGRLLKEWGRIRSKKIEEKRSRRPMTGSKKTEGAFCNSTCPASPLYSLTPSAHFECPFSNNFKHESVKNISPTDGMFQCRAIVEILILINSSEKP